LPALDAAGAALDFLYRDILHVALDELPLPRQTQATARSATLFLPFGKFHSHDNSGPAAAPNEFADSPGKDGFKSGLVGRQSDFRTSVAVPERASREHA
jgi:hypothetical protein